MPTITQHDNCLVARFGNELLQIEPWGHNSLRVRSTVTAAITDRPGIALLEPPIARATITIKADGAASLTNGAITAHLNSAGWLRFTNADGRVLLEEFWQVDGPGDENSCLGLPAREFYPHLGSDHKLTMRFKANADERIYGMGQRQMANLDMKGCILELAHRNSQASIPFALSNLGYGFLWNNPAIGRVAFGQNMTEWVAEHANQLDYWITAGDTPAQIEEQYADATGHVPMMPEFATGFWQCKLRYKTQDELLSVAREYKRRGLPISVIVADFFHWPKQGDWKFDPIYWPDPAAMVAELRDMGIELMVSIWPMVDYNCENWDEMADQGMLVRTDRGTPAAANFMGAVTFFDPTNPAARDFVWSKAKANYHDLGIKLFWLDEAEPDLMGRYHYDWIRYQAGPGMEVTNLYPFHYAQTFYEGQKAAGQDDIVNLLRCCWAGSQRYATLLWSGDVHSTFESLRRQFAAGLSTGLSGIPWWTSDIGGFVGGDVGDPGFHELLIRWFQWAVFCPVTRLHGHRKPYDFDFDNAWRDFEGTLGSGAGNEVWSFGDEVCKVLTAQLRLREAIRPYVMEQMTAAHEHGAPVMRPLFYDFPDDAKAWLVEDEEMFGPDLLVAPVMEAGARSRQVYLPIGCRWIDAWSGQHFEGGRTLTVEAPIEHIPVFVREGAPVAFVFTK